MNARITRTFGAVAATAALTVALTACSQADDAKDKAGDAAGNATAAAGSAANNATSAGGGAMESMTGGASASGMPGMDNSAGQSAPVVPSTAIAAENGSQVTITDAPIIEEYAKYGYEKGHLGAPAGPVADLPGGKGKFLTLKGGTIYWSEATGAHVVHGAIGDKWGEEGHETGKLGFPTDDEKSEDGGIKQTFQNGSITFKDGKVTVS